MPSASPLRGLRFNCWCVPVVLGLALIGGGFVPAWYAMVQHWSESNDRLAQDHVDWMARACSGATTSTVAPWLEHSAGRVRGLTVLTWNADGWVVSQRHGDPGFAVDQPHTGIEESVQRARPTMVGAHVAAAPIRDHEGRTVGVLCAHIATLPMPSPRALIIAGIAILVLAGGLAWYLLRRIWLPVELLQRQVEDALAGRASTPSVTSAETAPLQAALSTLAARALASTVRPKPEEPTSPAP